MKKRLAVVLCAAMMLSACGGASTSDKTADTKGQTAADSKADATEGSKGDGKLVLSTYGLSEDISEDEVYTPFEQEFGCEIVTETGGTNDRYTKLAADSESSIDVIELSQAMTAKGADEGLFDTIDLSKIPNAENLIPAAKELAENGQGIPYTINSIGIIYNPELTGFEIKSFDDLWDSRLEGMVSIPEITTTFGPAMVYVAGDHAGTPVAEDEGKAAFEALAELKPNLVKTYTKSSDLINMFTSGEVAAAVVGDFGVPTIVAANPDLVYVTPEETYANFNTINITKNCKNKDLAIDFLKSTFAGSVKLYENILPTTGAIGTYAPAADSTAYQEPQEFWNNQPIFAKIVDFSLKTPTNNTSPYYYDGRNALGTQIQNIMNGADVDQAIADAQAEVEFTMGE